MEARDAIRASVRVALTNGLPTLTAHGSAGGIEPIRPAIIDSLTLGELRLTNVASVVLLQESVRLLPFPNPTPALNILGMIPLSSFAFMTIDYPAHQVVFSPQQDFHPPTGSNFFAVPLIRGEHGAEHVAIDLPGGCETTALVDTGDYDVLYLDRETIRRAGLESAMIGAETNRVSRVSGVGEQIHEVTALRVDSFGLGEREFRKMRASTDQVGVGNRLGSRFLRWFKVTFDFKRRLLWLEGSELVQPTSPANVASPLGERARVYIDHGNVNHALGDFDGAITDYSRAIKIDSKNALAYNNRGLAKKAKGDLDGALADYNQAIELDPKNANAYVGHGNAKSAKGDLDGALADYNQAIELDPKNALAYNNRGLAKKAKGNLDGALADYNRAIELKPDFSDAYVGRGLAKYDKHDLDGALADYTKAIECDPKNALAYSNRGDVKKAKGNLDGALADYTRAIECDPKCGSAYHSRGCIRYDTRSFADALLDFRKELDSGSGFPDYAHYRVWLIRARLGEKDAATEGLRNYFDHRQAGKPDDWQAQIGRFLAGQLTEAEFLKAAESMDKQKHAEQHCEAWFYAGTVRLVAGDKATAKEHFENCLATGENEFTEYTSAEAELKRLQAGK